MECSFSFTSDTSTTNNVQQYLFFVYFQDANVKLIRELREEIEKLRTMLHTTNEVQHLFIFITCFYSLIIVDIFLVLTSLFTSHFPMFVHGKGPVLHSFRPSNIKARLQSYNAADDGNVDFSFLKKNLTFKAWKINMK